MDHAERTGSRPSPASVTRVFLMAVALATASFSCSPVDSTPPAPARPGAPAETTGGSHPDIVLIVVAGLRADPPGEQRAGDAFLGAVGREPTVRFRNAYAPSVSPFITLGSLLVGAYPSSIPLCGYYVESGSAAKQAAWCADIPQDRHTLPEILGLYGYRTALISGGQPRLAPLADEFQTWSDVPVSTDDRGGRWDALRREAASWWEKDDTTPRFLVVFAEDMVETTIPPIKAELGLTGDPLQQLLQPLADEGGEPRAIANPDHESVGRRYEADARAMGAGASSVVEALSGGPPGASPWFVVASTNGINLLEPGGYAEGGVYPLDSGLVLDRTVRVPVAVYGPGSPGESRDEEDVIELLDLFPTLVHLAGVTAPADMREVDLLDSEAASRGEAYMEFGDMLALRKGRYLLAFRALIHDGNALDPELDRRLRDNLLIQDEGAYGLYDVVADPMQEHNLLKTRSSEVSALRQRLLQIRADAGAVPASALTPERLWEIRMSPSQGYW